MSAYGDPRDAFSPTIASVTGSDLVPVLDLLAGAGITDVDINAPLAQYLPARTIPQWVVFAALAAQLADATTSERPLAGTTPDVHRALFVRLATLVVDRTPRSRREQPNYLPFTVTRALREGLWYAGLVPPLPKSDPYVHTEHQPARVAARTRRALPAGVTLGAASAFAFPAVDAQYGGRTPCGAVVEDQSVMQAVRTTIDDDAITRHLHAHRITTARLLAPYGPRRAPSTNADAGGEAHRAGHSDGYFHADPAGGPDAQDADGLLVAALTCCAEITLDELATMDPSGLTADALVALIALQENPSPLRAH